MDRSLVAGVVALVLIANTSNSFGQSGAPRLVGTWALASYKRISGDGKVVRDVMGPTPAGRLTYDAHGNMTVQLMRPDRCCQSMAYFGKYKLGDAEQTVIHTVEGGTEPSFVGTDQKRLFQLSGDDLTLSTPLVDGVEFRLLWKRLR
jgi:Lipocalin-like domain